MPSHTPPFSSPSLSTISLSSHFSSSSSSSSPSTTIPSPALSHFDLSTRLTALSSVTTSLLCPQTRPLIFSSTSVLPVIPYTFAWAGMHLSPHPSTSTYSFRLRPEDRTVCIARCPGTGRWLLASPLERVQEEKEIRFGVHQLVDGLRRLEREMREGWDEVEWKGLALRVSLGSEWEGEVLQEMNAEETRGQHEKKVCEAGKEAEGTDEDDEWDVVIGKKMDVRGGFLLV